MSFKKYWLLFFGVSVNSLFAQTSNLLFKSSFNYNVVVDKTVSWNHHLKGKDTVTNYTFPKDLPGNNTEDYFNYVIGDEDNYFEYANAEIKETTGYDGNPTNALYIEFIKDDTNFVSYSRVQYVMYGDSTSNDAVERMNQGYVKYKIKSHLDHTDTISDWRIPIEWKDMEDDGFRVGLYIYDSNTDSPYWVAKGQYMENGELGEDVWEFENQDIPVTEDDWFELEVYWYGHPDSTLGKFKAAIDGQVLFDVTNQTKDPDNPDKMFYFMPFKVYGTVGYSWITDFEYRDIPPSSSVLSDSALPVDLVDFSGETNNKQIKLKWSTSGEINNFGFRIQKSNNGKDWNNIKFVKGRETTNGSNHYEYIDEQPFCGTNYYRLQQIDFDGAFDYSKVISLRVRKDNNIEIYPNPTTGNLELTGDEVIEIKILDSFGRIVKKLTKPNKNIDISGFADGLYFISLKTEKDIITKRIIKE